MTPSKESIKAPSRVLFSTEEPFSIEISGSVSTRAVSIGSVSAGSISSSFRVSCALAVAKGHSFSKRITALCALRNPKSARK